MGIRSIDQINPSRVILTKRLIFFDITWETLHILHDGLRYHSALESTTGEPSQQEGQVNSSAQPIRWIWTSVLLLMVRFHDRFLVVVRLSTTSARCHCKRSWLEAIRSRKLQHHCLDCHPTCSSHCRPNVRQGRPSIHIRCTSVRRSYSNLPCWHREKRRGPHGSTLLHWYPRWLIRPLPSMEHWILRQEHRRHR